MRIAFVSVMAGSPWAASEVLWAETATLALAEGHDVLVSTFDWPERPQAIRDLEQRGARLEVRPVSRWYRRSALVTRLKRSFRALDGFNPDVICVSQGGTYDVARRGGNTILRSTLRKLGVPYVLLCHCEQPAPPERNVPRAQAMFTGAAVVGMVAAKLRPITEKHLGLRLPNVRVFHNPVNLKTIERLPWPSQAGTLKFAFVARLDPVKNLSALIEALAQQPWSVRDWTLTVHGAGPERASLEQQVRNASLSDRIRFAGFATDIAAVWREHHLLVMPSRFEGVPLAMIEAMLCGRPVVATDIGGIAEWIEEGCNGFLIDAPRTREIGEALERAWNHRHELEAMGRHAHERTLAKRDSDPARTLLGWLTDATSAAVSEAAVISPAPHIQASGTRARISVVIPTYEPGRFLGEAIKSVLAQDPGQDVMQIAIVDDGSVNSHAHELLPSVAPAGRVEIHAHDRNLGLAGNWNRAISLARGEFIHILHQDDVVQPGFYDRLISALDRSARIGMAFCRHAYINENNIIDRISHRERWRAGVLRDWLGRIVIGQRIQCPSAIVKRSVYERLGGFRPELIYALDWEMWVRIAVNYEVWYEPATLAHYRRHETAESARLQAAGRINVDLMNAIELFSAYLPAPERARLKGQAYRGLARLQLRRASKLLQGQSRQSAADQVECARATLERLPENLAKRWARDKLMRLEAQLASDASSSSR
jgi:L-malate glycosyltransferase